MLAVRLGSIHEWVSRDISRGEDRAKRTRVGYVTGDGDLGRIAFARTRDLDLSARDEDLGDTSAEVEGQLFDTGEVLKRQ